MPPDPPRKQQPLAADPLPTIKFNSDLLPQTIEPWFHTQVCYTSTDIWNWPLHIPAEVLYLSN